jgi:hypothetical protein
MEWNPNLAPAQAPGRAAVQYSEPMRAPRRRPRALAGAAAGSRPTASEGAQMRVSPRLRWASQDLSFAIRRSTRRLGGVVTPLRATVCVGAVAALALAASQFMHYGEVAVGTGQYAAYPGLEAVAQPPPVSTDSFGVAHGLLMIALAAIALVALFFALRRSRLGLVVFALGAVVVAVALLADLPKGLDEGTAAIRYEGASATLTAGFWVELVAGALLAAIGLLVVFHSRGPAPARTARARRASRPRSGPSPRPSRAGSKGPGAQRPRRAGSGSSE